MKFNFLELKAIYEMIREKISSYEHIKENYPEEWNSSHYTIERENYSIALKLIKKLEESVF